MGAIFKNSARGTGRIAGQDGILNENWRTCFYGDFLDEPRAFTEVCLSINNIYLSIVVPPLKSVIESAIFQ